MAKRLPKTLNKLASSLLKPSQSFPISLSSRLLSHRNFHTKASLPNSDSNGTFPKSSATAFSDDIAGFLGFRTIEDAIHSTIVRHSAPDWLPFVPGSSYWVPPKRRADKKFVQLVEKLVNPLTVEEPLSLGSSRGWPCFDVFVDQGLASEHSSTVEVEIQVHDQTGSKRTPSEDED